MDYCRISHEQIYCRSLQATQDHYVVSLFFPSLPLLKVLDHHQWSADWPPHLLFTTELSQINPWHKAQINLWSVQVCFEAVCRTASFPSFSIVCVNAVKLFSKPGRGALITVELLFIRKSSSICVWMASFWRASCSFWRKSCLKVFAVIHPHTKQIIQLHTVKIGCQPVFVFFMSCIHVTSQRSKDLREQVSSDLSIDEKHYLVLYSQNIRPNRGMSEALCGRICSDGISLGQTSKTTSRTGRDTGFSYTCAVNLGLWTKVNKITEGGEAGVTFFTFFPHNSQTAPNLPAIFWYKQHTCVPTITILQLLFHS